MTYRRVFIVLGGVLCLVAGVCYANGMVGQRLCVRNAAKELVFFSSLPQSQLFCIRFIHSVAKSPVEEWFRVRSGQIVLESTVYQDFGAGLPHEAGKGQRMDFDKGLVRISGYDLPIAPLVVRVGRIAGHTLLLEASGQHTVGTVASPVAPASQESNEAPPQIFATEDTQGKRFTIIKLDALALAGSALTFSAEFCFWKYCLE